LACDVAELELQTSVLRSQAARQSSASQALTDCQALLQQRQQQLEELQQKQELSQVRASSAMGSYVHGQDSAEGIVNCAGSIKGPCVHME
jgi:hypothetical protein